MIKLEIEGTEKDMHRATWLNSRIAALACALMALACSPTRAEPLAAVFSRTYSQLETDKLYRGYLEHLGTCTGDTLTNHFGQPLFGRLYVAETVPEAQIPALMRAGRIQLALVPASTAVVLESQGVAEIAAIRGQVESRTPEMFDLLLLVRSDTQVSQPAQLAQAKVAFPSARPRRKPGTQAAEPAGDPHLDDMIAAAAMKQVGLDAGSFRVEYAGGHERALAGLKNGFWQGAFLASDQLDRMVKKREARAQDVRAIWHSSRLPADSIVVLKAAPAALKARIARCTLAFRFNEEQTRLFEGSDGFLPADPAYYEPYRQLLTGKP